MAGTFALKVVTPQRTVFQADVESVVVPGMDGYFGVLAGHAPMLAEVGVGRLTTRAVDGKEQSLAVAGGFMEVLGDSATVLADAAELSGDIDVNRAEAAAGRARERLEAQSQDVDTARAAAALARAINRVEVAGRH